MAVYSPTFPVWQVVLIEDGPTLTHGGMAYGAGKVGPGARHARTAPA